MTEPPSLVENGHTPEPEPQWYKQGIVLTLTPFLLFVLWPDFLPCVKGHASYVAIWAATATLAYPAWAWLEMQAFEPWVRRQRADLRPIERAFFKANNDLAKNFWTALFGIYATAGILLFLKAP